MPKLWKFLNKESDKEAPRVQDYKFENAADLELAPDAEEPEEEVPAPEETPEPAVPENDPIDFARIQAESIVKDAEAQAEEILRKAREEAEAQREAAREQGRQEGYEAGFGEGRQQGVSKAMEDAAKEKENLETEFGRRVEAFSKSAERALTHQLNDNLKGMRDLAIAVAEKVVCISLRSSSEVIAKMIQTAVDKQKRREWVHIYISEGDAKGMTSLPPALASALSELSDHVRIIPMADDESGTCIVEFPDEIIDASVSTQLQNIRELLNAQSGNKR